MNFSFPRSLELQLSSGWDQPMGSLVVPVKELLAEPQLVLDQWFHLDGASPESQILLRTELKVRNMLHLPTHTHTLTLFFSLIQQLINNYKWSYYVFVSNRF